MGEKILRPLWSMDDVIKYLGVGKTMAYQLVGTGKIPSIKIGRKRRFLPDEVERAVKKLSK